jgi:hypothetical protein
MATRDSSKKAPTGRDTVILPLAELSVTFHAPEPGQLAALRRAANLFGSADKAAQGKGGMLFLDVLDALVTDEGILDRIYSGMADESIPLEDYAECAIALLKHFVGEQEEEAPRNGPVSTRRASARSGPRR